MYIFFLYIDSSYYFVLSIYIDYRIDDEVSFLSINGRRNLERRNEKWILFPSAGVGHLIQSMVHRVDPTLPALDDFFFYLEKKCFLFEKFKKYILKLCKLTIMRTLIIKMVTIMQVFYVSWLFKIVFKKYEVCQNLN